MDEINVYHSGIKGMKWGIRRYQNPDGSLTDEGRRRYSKINGLSENEKSKIKKGAAIGAGIGAVGSAASTAATIGLGLASGGVLLVPISQVMAMGAASAAVYAANGAIKGAAVGAIIGSKQTKKAQKYMSNYSDQYNTIKVKDLHQ